MAERGTDPALEIQEGRLRATGPCGSGSSFGLPVPGVTQDPRQESETSPNPFIKEPQSESFDPVNRTGDLLPMPT